MTDNEVSVYISAKSIDNARDLFELAISHASSGDLFDGSLLFLDDDRPGCVQLYTFAKKGL